MVSTPPSEPSMSSRAPESHSTDDDDAGSPTKLLSISWNQDYKCFAVGATDGFRLYNCDPFGEALRRESRGAGFGIVEMLYRCNCFALVGDGSDPQMPPNKVKIWDDLHDRFTGELAFRSNVCAVKLREDRIVVVLERMIYVYRFPDVKLLGKIVTSANPNGVCSLSHDSKNAVLACPGVHTGQVRIENFGLKTMTFISAHDSQIACLALSSDGRCCATASTKGTLVRLFNTTDGTCLQEVRRGTDKADIYSITFSPNLQWLAVTSGRGTVHVFSLRNHSVGEYGCRKNFFDEGPGRIHQNSSTSHAAITSPKMGVNPSSKLSFFKGMLPKYFSSEWSFAQFHLSEATRYVAAFGAENTVAIVGMNGSFYRCSFDPVSGGQMLQKEHVRFVEGLQ